MFLNATLARNNELVQCAFDLHESGVLPADTYVIDRDAVDSNAAALSRAARASNLELWFVVKQIGRNPLLIESILHHLPYAAAIDVREAEILHRHGAKYGNVGHISQIPRRFLPQILARAPKVVTVFDEENIAAVGAAARNLGIEQGVLLRIEGAKGTVYPGQEGGFSLTSLPAVLRFIERCDGVRTAGVTAFPGLVFNTTLSRPVTTPNAQRLLDAASILRENGIDAPIIDLPSHSSVATIPMLAELGVTHAEPGHALTGTTPQHAIDLTLAEKPAMVYLTEIAHRYSDGPAVFGGGFYPRGHTENAVIRTRTGDTRCKVRPGGTGNIDYYRTLEMGTDTDRPAVGDGVVMAFRTQIFVTRSLVAIVSGLERHRPHLDGIFDSQGQELAARDVGATQESMAAL